MQESPVNPEEQFVQLFAKHERDLRAFVRSMGLSWVAVDDIVQTVSLVMWRKWHQFDPNTDFMQWSRVIARFEVLKYRRKMGRDRHVFREDVMILLAEVSEELDTEITPDDYRIALQQCIALLPDKSSRLVIAAYSQDRTIKEFAQEIGRSASALYKTLNRIRERLRRCVRQRLLQT